MSKVVVHRLVMIGLILSMALGTGVLWWLVLSEEPKPPMPASAPRSVSAPRDEVDKNRSTSLVSTSEFKHRPCHPLFHVEPYLQHPTPSAISILWETTRELPGAVEYGESEALGQVLAEDGPERKFHEVRLTGLKSATLYYYRVRSGEAVSPVYSFRTAPAAGTQRWRIAVYGDSRSNPAVHRAIVEQMAKQRVDLIVHTGDMVSNGKNHAAWAREFFAPLAPLACRVPIIGVLGNHEADSPLYFSYFALPGNERFYTLQYGSARFVCLDSNIREGKAPWVKEQEEWFSQQLRQLDSQAWNFVVFHQPLFSAHATRAISPLRWQWTGQLLAHPVHLVLNAHDHFYARTWPVGLYDGETNRGVIFVTTAGGGAPLYRTRGRSYIAGAIALHHFLVLESAGEELTVSAFTQTGRLLDQFVIRKGASPSEFFCWESELLRENLRRAIAEAPSLPVTGGRSGLHGELRVPHAFRVPLQVRLRWTVPPGWRLPVSESTLPLMPGEPLRLPLQAEVHAEATHLLPRLRLELNPLHKAPGPGQAHAVLPFRNREIVAYPFKLVGPETYSVARIGNIEVNGRADDEAWRQAGPLWLPRVGFGSLTAGAPLPLQLPGLGISASSSHPGTGARWSNPGGETTEVALPAALESPPEVRLAANQERLFVLVRVPDRQRRIRVKVAHTAEPGTALALYDNHVRLELNDGQQLYTYAVSAENITYHAVQGSQLEGTWLGRSDHDGQAWVTEFGIALSSEERKQDWRANVVVFLKDGSVQYEWRANRPVLADTEMLPSWDLRSPSQPKTFARLRWPQ